MNVVTAGTFDLPHVGHINLVNWCRILAGSSGKVFVFVNDDDFIYRFKHRKPVLNLDERMNFISKVGVADYVYKNTGDENFQNTLTETVLDGKPIADIISLIVIGSDWHQKDYLSQLHTDWEWLRNKNIGICYIPYTAGISSTDLKKRIKESL